MSPLPLGGEGRVRRLVLSYQHTNVLFSKPGPGYCHFPDKYDVEYFKQLTVERRTINGYGRPYYKWVKVNTRNEALDRRVYSMAALEILNPNFESQAKLNKPYDFKQNKKRRRRRVLSKGVS